MKKKRIVNLCFDSATCGWALNYLVNVLDDVKVIATCAEALSSTGISDLLDRAIHHHMSRDALTSEIPFVQVFQFDTQDSCLNLIET